MPIKLRLPKIWPDVESPVLTTAEAAKYLKVSKETLYEMVKDGWIVPSRTPGGHYRFTIQQLNEALEQSKRR